MMAAALPVRSASRKHGAGTARRPDADPANRSKIYMRNLLITGAAMVAAAAALPAPALAQGQAPSDGVMVSFSVSEEVKKAPDRASIGAGVTTTGPTAVEALRANSIAMDKLIAAAKKAGIRPTDIQTTGINISPQYDYRPQEQGQPPKLTGYQASNQVRVVSRDIAGLGVLIDTLIAAGGTNIDGPSFFVANPDAMLDGARAAVLAKANARAADYARLTGYREARLIALTEGGGWIPSPQPVMQMGRAEMAADAKMAAPVQPGEVGNTLTVQVQYRLVR